MGDSEQSGPTLVFILGAPAVGKMTVGQEVERISGYGLFHVHQVIDLVTTYFEWDSPACNRLLLSFRRAIFEEATAAGKDLITTGSWQFDQPQHTGIFMGFVEPYLEQGGRVCFVELLAPLAVRLARNLTENRRRHKRTDWSTEAALRDDDVLHRYDSSGRLPIDLPRLRLETESLSAEEVAEQIVVHYGLSKGCRSGR